MWYNIDLTCGTCKLFFVRLSGHYNSSDEKSGSFKGHYDKVGHLWGYAYTERSLYVVGYRVFFYVGIFSVYISWYFQEADTHCLQIVY